MQVLQYKILEETYKILQTIIFNMNCDLYKALTTFSTFYLLLNYMRMFLMKLN